MEVEPGKVCRDNIFSSLVALSKNISDSDNNKALKQKEIISSYIETWTRGLYFLFKISTKIWEGSFLMHCFQAFWNRSRLTVMGTFTHHIPTSEKLQLPSSLLIVNKQCRNVPLNSTRIYYWTSRASGSSYQKTMLLSPQTLSTVYCPKPKHSCLLRISCVTTF